MSNFYDNYFEFSPEDATKHKDNYIRKIITNGTIYKFVGFDNNSHLNSSKICCFENDSIWTSHYKYFEDRSELKTLCNLEKVTKKTKRTRENIKFFLDITREIYDIACFTTEISEYMWENYANSHSGFCICFEMLDTDKLFPIEYVNKSEVDLTNTIIKLFNDSDNGKNIFYTRELKEASLLPIVLKDKKYENEKELRFMYSSFDDENGKFKGNVYPDIKEEFSHKGTSVSYELIGLKTKKIIIGHNCQKYYRDNLIKIAEKKSIDIEKNR